jgi:hypothetical protein
MGVLVAQSAVAYLLSTPLFMQIGILFVIAFADLTIGMVMAHLFAIDPKWLAHSPRR